jgi:hypothetical protein
MTYETSFTFVKEGGAKFFFSSLNLDSTFFLDNSWNTLISFFSSYF